jgi:hypothetical protein
MHLDYVRIEEEIIATQDRLAAEREANKAMRDSFASYNVQMQAFMAVRKKNAFVAFLTFSDMYVC